MERFQNWMSFSFDDEPVYGPKPAPDSVFHLHFAPDIVLQPLDYYESLRYNAQMIAEHYPGPFDVLLSGGLDSEIVVRVFRDLGIPQRVHTFRFENNHNLQDVLSAQAVARQLDIKLNIIDFNLEHWFETQAHDMYHRTYVPLVELLPRFAWFDYFDGTIVFGDGEPYWRRLNGGDYTQPGQWAMVWDEDDWSNSIYSRQISRPIIAEWYQYTPEITFHFTKLPLVRELLRDRIAGKQSSWSSRTDIHRHLWPDISYKPKMVGYEGLGMPNTRPEFMTRFQEQVMAGVTNRKFVYTEQQVVELLCKQ